MYLLFRGGLLATSSGAEDLNKFGLGAISALAGLFSNTAIRKLQTTFDHLLGMTEPEHRDRPSHLEGDGVK